MPRPSLRKSNQIRPVSIETGVNKWAEGSCLIKIGGTHIICNASVEQNQPLWKRQQNLPGGWVVAEYSMLPRAVDRRKSRDAITKDHRSAEITRLIGRAFRSVIDMDKLGRHTIVVDCDVIQADGGTRCAAITGGFVALKMAIDGLVSSGRIRENPVSDYVAAVSAGIWKGEAILDLEFEEDCAAELDSNFVISGSGKFIEIQATGEEHPFEAEKMTELMTLAQEGCKQLVELQKQVFEE